jgi:hypothetical protein
MKTKIFIPLLLIVLVGCSEIPKEHRPIVSNPDILYGMNIVQVDSCEYVVYSSYQQSGITHKGNCKFCIERSKRK